MKIVFSTPFEAGRSGVLDFVKNFENEGKEIYKGRNSVKIFELDGDWYNVKAFRKPNLINKFAYRYFRKSKAERSFEYARLLLEKGIGTPEPVAYMEENGIFFGKSYYVSRQVDYDFTFRELISMEDLKKRNEILRQFTAFTYKIHEQGIEFLDHSPGNTLIVDKGDGQYDFYLVDLNRMKFHDHLSLRRRIYNFRRLTAKKEIIAEISKTYAALAEQDFEVIFKDMWEDTRAFRTKFERKKRMKRYFKKRKR